VLVLSLTKGLLSFELSSWTGPAALVQFAELGQGEWGELPDEGVHPLLEVDEWAVGVEGNINQLGDLADQSLLEVVGAH